MEQIQSFTLRTLESGEEIHTDVVLTVYANKVFLPYIRKYSWKNSIIFISLDIRASNTAAKGRNIDLKLVRAERVL